MIIWWSFACVLSKTNFLISVCMVCMKFVNVLIYHFILAKNFIFLRVFKLLPTEYSYILTHIDTDYSSYWHMALFTCKKKSHIQALLIVISSLIPCVVVLMSILTQRKWRKKFKENYSCHKSLTFHIIYHCQIEVCFKLDWDDWGTFISVRRF